jgi:tetratricopeptide (TPR) repeat protein
LVEISKLDKILKKHSNLASKFGNLADVRKLLNPSEKSWWWSIESNATSFWDRFDWLWGALTIPWLAVNLSLIVDISSRFLTGTPDTISTFAIVFQSVLAALATGGALTKAGQDLVNGVFGNLKIPKRFWHEAKFCLALILSIFLILFRIYLPSVAIFYNKRGFENFNIGRLDNAKQDFVQAIRLDSNFMEAHYNLGQIYERLQDTDNALKEYKTAAELGSVRAHVVIGRIYNLKKDYSLAAYFILRGKSILDTRLNGSSIDRDIDTQYAIFRNLGWSRLEQRRYFEAQASLEDAIKLVPSRSTGYCLMAQVYKKNDQAKNQAEKAKYFWGECLKYSLLMTQDTISIELDEWIGMAKKELNSYKTSK